MPCNFNFASIDCTNCNSSMSGGRSSGGRGSNSIVVHIEVSDVVLFLIMLVVIVIYSAYVLYRLVVCISFLYLSE